MTLFSDDNKPNPENPEVGPTDHDVTVTDALTPPAGDAPPPPAPAPAKATRSRAKKTTASVVEPDDESPGLDVESILSRGDNEPPLRRSDVAEFVDHPPGDNINPAVYGG